MITDFGDDCDGDLAGYDGGYGEPTMCPYGHGPLENCSCPDCGYSL